MSDRPVEIELKLRVDQTAARKILRDQAIKSLIVGKATRKRLHSTYFDTPDFNLREDGIVLRVRRVGRARIQTVKARLPQDAGLLTRMEEETPLRSERPDLSLIRDRRIAKNLTRKRIATRLAAQFSTEFVRTSADLRLPTGEVELAIDTGKIVAGKHVEPICEIEIELRSGAVTTVYELGRRLAEIADVTIEPRSKADRAYALLSGAAIEAARAAEIVLDADMTLGEAMRRVGQNCADQIRRNLLAVRLARSDEAVHQLRVGLRRARTLMSILRPLATAGSTALFADGLKSLMAELSAAREWDVFQAEVVPHLTRAIDPEAALGGFIAAIEAQREEAHRRASAAVCSPAASRTVLDFESWIEGGGAWAALGAEADRPARDAAREILQRLAKKVTRLLDGIAEAEDERIHQLRLRAKRLRYGAEFFASLFATKKAKPYLRALAALQDHLGAFNDGVVGAALVAALPVNRTSQAQLARAIDSASGWCAAIGQRERAAVPDALETFLEQKPFWR